MQTLYFVDAQGNYLGGFQGAEPPAGSIEVPSPPAHGLMVWDFASQTWADTPARRVAAAKAGLAASDPWAARMGEDLLGLLIGKGILSQADLATLPQAAQDKLAQRRAWRVTIQNGG